MTGKCRRSGSRAWSSRGAARRPRPRRARNRHVDLTRRDRSAARAQRRRQVDHDRHDPGAGPSRWRQRVGVRPRPVDAVKAGLVGGMLQTGELIRGLSVRELVSMVASLYPDPLDVDEVLELAGLDRRPPSSDAEALRAARPSAAVRGRASSANPELLILDEPTVAMDVEGRRAFWVAMRGFAARGKTVDVRDPLPRGGRHERRPRGAAGARPRSSPTAQRPRSRAASARARSARRFPASRPPSWPRSPGVQLRRAPRRGGDPGVLGLRSGDPRAADAISRRARHRDHRRRARGRVPAR